MNQEEMKMVELKKLFDLFSGVDGGCPTCVKNIFLGFVKKFPEYSKEAADYWESQEDYPFCYSPGEKNSQFIAGLRDPKTP